MKLQFRYDINTACNVILQEKLIFFDIPFIVTTYGEIELIHAIPNDKYKQFEESINKYGIQILDNPKTILVQKIKDAITDLVYREDKLPNSKISAYLADKLNHSYGYLSNFFSELTFSTIENFIILQRIERAKKLILENDLTLTEVASKLNYSSVAHLSNQFKKTTGLTPTTFQRIIKKRTYNNLVNQF